MVSWKLIYSFKTKIYQIIAMITLRCAHQSTSSHTELQQLKFFHNLEHLDAFFLHNLWSYWHHFCTTGKRIISFIHLHCITFREFFLLCENAKLWCSELFDVLCTVFRMVLEGKHDSWPRLGFQTTHNLYCLTQKKHNRATVYLLIMLILTI